MGSIYDAVEAAAWRSDRCHSLYLVPTGAHLFEMSGKLALAPAGYMVAQRLYAGWQAFGVVIGMGITLALAQNTFVRRDHVALVCVQLDHGAWSAAKTWQATPD